MQPISNKGNTSAYLSDLSGCQKFTLGTASPRRNPFTLQAVNPHDLCHNIQGRNDQFSPGILSCQQGCKHRPSPKHTRTKLSTSTGDKYVFHVLDLLAFAHDKIVWTKT